MINVQIAEENLQQAFLLANYLTKDKQLNIINVTNDAENTIDAYFDSLPDVLILSSSLLKSTGVNVLEYLCTFSLKEKNKCNIIILFEDSPKYKFSYVNKVFRVIEKPANFDSIYTAIHEIYNSSIKKPNLRRVCYNTALRLGFNLNSIGTTYLIDCVIYLFERKTSIFDFDHLCHEIAKKYETTSKKVKWGLRNSISSMYRYCNPKMLQALFPEYDGRKPTPKYTISVATEELLKLYMNE